MLSLEQCKRLHRELWFWLENRPDKPKQDWPRWDGNDRLPYFGGEFVYGACFACYYALRVDLKVDKSDDPKMPALRTAVPSLYVGGDGSGWTRGLSQASKNGLLIGYDIARRAA